MTRYSVQFRDRIFGKGCVSFCFVKSMGKNIGKRISKNLSGKYSSGMLAMLKKRLDHAKQCTTDAFKTASKRGTQKTVEETEDLIGNDIANKITKVSNNSL